MNIIYSYGDQKLSISKKKSKRHLIGEKKQNKSIDKKDINESLLLFRSHKRYKRRDSSFDFEVIYARNKQGMQYPRYLLLHIGIQNLTRVKSNVVQQLLKQNKQLLGDNTYLYIKEYSDTIVLFELSHHPIERYYELFYDIKISVEKEFFINLPAIATLAKLNEKQIIHLEHDIFVNRYTCSLMRLYNSRASTLHKIFRLEKFAYCNNCFVREFRLRKELYHMVEDEYDVQKIIYKQYKIVLIMLTGNKCNYYHIVNDEQILELLVPAKNRHILMSYIENNKPFSLNAMKKLLGIPRCNIPNLLDYFKVSNRYKKIQHPTDASKFKILLRSANGKRDRENE